MSTATNAGGSPRLPLLMLPAFRLILLIALPFEALIGYGDYQHFFNLARLAADQGGGLPYIGHWVEFPPLFPFLSLLLYKLAAGKLHLYVYLLALLMIGFDLGSLWFFRRLTRRFCGPSAAERLLWIYAFFLAIPAFGWWTFEPLAVFLLLAAISLVLDRKVGLAGLAAGAGLLTKLFPIAALLLFLVRGELKSFLRSTLVVACLVAAVMVPLLVVAPEMTAASLASQSSKGSWETVWALLDGNRGTGSFGVIEDRLDPAIARRAPENPARIPHWVPSVLAIGLLAALWWRGRSQAAAEPLWLLVFFCVLFLWSPGWSPQWTAYLMPVILLALPLSRALGFGGNLILSALIEWPLLLSRGLFDLLWIPVILRTVLLALLLLVAAAGLTARPLPENGGER